MAAVTSPARHAALLATSASNREPRQSKAHRAMEWPKPSSARSSVTMSASVRVRMQRPSCTSYQLGSLTTTVCRQSISDSWLGNLRECLAHLVKGSGCDCLLMQAASLLDGFSFDLFPPFENGLAAPEVDVSRRQVVQALVVSTVVVVPDELLDVLFELSWQVVVVQQNPVFHRAMISLDLALRHRVVRPAADMSDAVVLKPLTKLARHVGWTVIAQQPWPMQNLDLVQT